ncbi:hypothetical protein ABH939_006719 [Rhodococcus sp. 27YEA6]|jgi:transposase
MYAKSTLSYSDAVSALEVFEESLTANPVHMLYQQWQLREAGVLVTRERRHYDFETKLEIVRRNVNGESGSAKPKDHTVPQNLSSLVDRRSSAASSSPTATAFSG